MFTSCGSITTLRRTFFMSLANSSLCSHGGFVTQTFPGTVLHSYPSGMVNAVKACFYACARNFVDVWAVRVDNIADKRELIIIISLRLRLHPTVLQHVKRLCLGKSLTGPRMEGRLHLMKLNSVQPIRDECLFRSRTASLYTASRISSPSRRIWFWQ